MKTHDPIPVEIVTTGSSSWPVPSLCSTWSDLDKLRWRAGCVAARANTGPIRITTDCRSVDGRVQSDLFGWSMPNISGGASTFTEMWSFLIGVEVGTRIAR